MNSLIIFLNKCNLFLLLEPTALSHLTGDLGLLRSWTSFLGFQSYVRYLALVQYFLYFLNRMLTVRGLLILPLSQNFVLGKSLGCFFILFNVDGNILSLLGSKRTILDHAETFLTIIIFAYLFSLVRIIMFDNDFWYISYFLNLIFFLSIFVLNVIMSMWLPIFAVITLAITSAANAMLETLAILLLALRPFACAAFEMCTFGSGILFNDLLFKCVYSLFKDLLNGYFSRLSLCSDIDATFFIAAAIWTTIGIILQALTVKLRTLRLFTFAANLSCYFVFLFQLFMTYGLR